MDPLHTNILRKLEMTLARQRMAVQASEEHIAAVRAISERANRQTDLLEKLEDKDVAAQTARKGK